MKNILATLIVIVIFAGIAACMYDSIQYGDMEWGRGAPVEATAYLCVRPSFFGLIDSSEGTCLKKTVKACLKYSSDSPAECAREAEEIVRQEYAFLEHEKQRSQEIARAGL